jgi:hypothetical protein
MDGEQEKEERGREGAWGMTGRETRCHSQMWCGAEQPSLRNAFEQQGCRQTFQTWPMISAALSIAVNTALRMST